MKFAFFLALAMVPGLIHAQDDKPVTYTERLVGIQFDHPSTWKTLKTEKDRVTMAVPVPGSTEFAELQLVNTDFHSDKQVWQDVQLEVNRQMKREVAGQWEQEILGVPLLCTRINYTDKSGIAKAVLTGLYYTRTPRKLLIRMEMRQTDYENVTYEFFQALQTIRTIDGKAPQTDDPSAVLGPATPVKPTPVERPPTVLTGPGKETKVEVPTGRSELTLGAGKIAVLFPEEWKAEVGEDNVLLLTHPEVTEPVRVQVMSSVDGDSPEKTLFRLSSESLKLYTKVDIREDRTPTTNRAGASVATVWRAGQMSSGPIGTFEATGQLGDNYFVVTFRQPNGKDLKRDRELVEELVRRMTLAAAS